MSGLCPHRGESRDLAGRFGEPYQRRGSAFGSSLNHLDAVSRADVAELGRGQPVRDEGVDFGHMANADRSGALKFRLIANEKHAPGIVDDGSGDVDFAWIVIKQRSVVVER